MMIGVVPAVGILLLLRFGWKKGGVFLLAEGFPPLRSSDTRRRGALHPRII